MLGRLGGGPFLQLPAGYYRLEISADAGTPRMAAEPVLGVEITARRRWLDGRWRSWNSLLGRPPPRGVQLAWRDFTCAELRCGTASFDFEVPAELALEGGEDIVIGLHLRRLGNAGLAIKGVDVRQMTAAGAAPKSRQWRLLGRLSKGRIGVRQADGVAVAAFGLVQIPLVAVQVAQVDECAGKTGSKGCGLAKTRLGFVP